jgi:hypothetical protein
MFWLHIDQAPKTQLSVRRRLLCLALLAVMLISSACGPRSATPAPADAEEASLSVELPAIYLDVAEDGAISLGEGPLQQTLTALGVDLSSASISADTVQKLVDNGIQTVQLDNRRDGLYIYVNGEAMPTLVWEEQSLGSLVNVLGTLGTDLGEAGKLLSILPDLGIGLVLRFPGASTARLAQLQAPPAAANQNTLQAAIESPTAINLTLTFGADGVGQLQGLNPLMMGMIPPGALSLPADTLASITEMGLQGVSIIARPTGLAILVNEEALPYLRAANEQQLVRMLQLVLQIAGGDSPQTAQITGMVQQLLPLLWAQGMRMNVNFPSA